MSELREVAVPLDRLGRWLDGFIERNGDVLSQAANADGFRLETDRGGSALLHGVSADHDADRDDLVAAAAGPDRRLAVVLIRRGGYSIAAVSTAGTRYDVTASKTDQKYVQGRTAAGGQSQQRFARRRSGQAAALVRAATGTAVRVLVGSYSELVTGGDVPLLEELLHDRRLESIARLPRRHVEIPGDPRRRSIDEAVRAARQVKIIVRNAPEAT